MKIKFDSDQKHQRAAWDSAVDVFAGQELNQTVFSITSARTIGVKDVFTQEEHDQGFGNRLRLPEERMLENVRNIQIRNGLKPVETMESLDFTIEMETGTGKTYVYLRSVFEMKKRYGMSKFIIVVPSLAIKEGTLKFLKITESHFKEQYDNIPYDYFQYDSSRLDQVRGFCVNDYLQIMVINIDAFRKSFTDPAKESKANVIHRWNDKMQGVPVRFVQSTNPIVIIDEPQSVDTTAKSAEAIRSLNPLCTFRYSATHIEKHNMLYKLDSIDAYEQKLVKQIEVASLRIKDFHNKAYVKLLSVDNEKGHRAKIELDIQKKSGVKRDKRWIRQGVDLFELSGGRSIYEGYVVNDIHCEEGKEYIDFTGKPEVIRLNHAIGDVDEGASKRLQIRKTVEEHLDKELRLRPMGIKVLSLFFIDRVANYRDENGPDGKGKYALTFEEEYAKAIRKPKYETLFSDADREELPALVHDGYFSRDKKGTLKDTRGTDKADEDTYALIMKDKEKLLSFDSKLGFIFSHSALKEGWDNPNVFQICTLNETRSPLKKRQEIGRGLRICVNQQGERVHGFEVNTLTVMVNESYEDFVKGLQKEIEEEEGIRFGVVERHGFANLVIDREHGEPTLLGTEKSEELWNTLLEKEYIDPTGKVTDKLKKALEDNDFLLPTTFQNQRDAVVAVLKKIAGGLQVKNVRDKRKISLNRRIFESAEFRDLWDRVKYKTVYDVKFDPEQLIRQCAESLRDNLVIGKAKYDYATAKTEINPGGVSVIDIREKTDSYDLRDYPLPDILSCLQNETRLKRKSVFRILMESGRLDSFKNNPQKFITQAKKLILSTMKNLIVDGIKYRKIGDLHFYAQELFESEELIGYLNKNMIQAEKSPYDHVVYDSGIESDFARKFESNQAVKVYAKLPGWFKIDTPLGAYNPDWAVLFEQEGKERLYFVVESKGTALEEDLRRIEKHKFNCGKEHFKAVGLENGGCVLADDYDTLIGKAEQAQANFRPSQPHSL